MLNTWRTESSLRANIKWNTFWSVALLFVLLFCVDLLFQFLKVIYAELKMGEAFFY